MALGLYTTFTLDMVPGGAPPIIHVSAEDVGRKYTVNLTYNGVPYDIQGNRLTIAGTKLDGTVFEYPVDDFEQGESWVDFLIKEQMSIIPGTVRCKLREYLNDDQIGSATFILDVDEYVYDPEAASESYIPSYETAIQEALENVADDIADLATAAAINDVKQYSDAASASATAAAGSATTASTKASEAAQSEANTVIAKNAAEAAQTAAEAAQTAAEAAQGKAEDAKGEAETTAQSIAASAAQIATNTADITQLKSDLTLTNSYIIEETDELPLPNVLKGNFKYTAVSANDMMISGTQNVAELLGIKQGTFVINGVTFNVSGTTVTISGQPTSDFNYSYVDGNKKTSTELSAMVLPLPVHLYTASQKVLSGSVFPAVMSRGKVSGNAFTTQNNTAVFAMDETVCGGLYSYLQASKTYDCRFIIALFPFSADNSNPYRNQISEISIYNVNGIYALEGYTWSIGDPIVTEIRSKLPKKAMCKYSTRTIDYSSMIECLDIYIPAKRGYINYIFGHTENQTSGGNVWRLVQIDSVNDALAYQFHITQLGETEMAIMISGRDDFIGGTTHGDEVMNNDSFKAMLDGKLTDVTSLTELTDFETLQVFLVSSMFDPADHTTQVGVHGREWTFDKDGLLLDQTVKYMTDLTLGNSYMPMLCVLRGNDTASQLQVTDTYIDDGNFTPYDVSVGGFTTYPNQLNADVKKIHLFGETSGVGITLEILKQPEGLNKEGTFLYNGVNTYNKIYCCLCGYGGGSNTQNVSNGDKWHVKTKIKIDVG